MSKGIRIRKNKIERINSDLIQRYIVRKECMKENVDYFEQGTWRTVGFTDVGIEVFCEKHGLPILSIDFLDVKRNLKMIFDILNEKCSCCGDSSSDCDNHQITN